MSKKYIAYYLGRKSENPNTTFVDRVICFFTNSRYSHAELIYDWSDVTKRGRCFSSSPRDNGVRGNTIGFDSGRWEVYELETDRTEDQIIEFFMPKIGKKYDWFGAIGSVIPPIRQNQSRWFCTEIILACLGYPNPWKYSPQEMFELLQEKQKRIL